MVGQRRKFSYLEPLKGLFLALCEHPYFTKDHHCFLGYVVSKREMQITNSAGKMCYCLCCVLTKNATFVLSLVFNSARVVFSLNLKKVGKSNTEY